jgi:SPP1 gp7 family putative phage head morphogenesis protein
MLQDTTNVTESRAMLIARTEVAKANASINEARALSVGSEGYIWRTAGDADVRESHAEMDGQYVAWSDPPTLSDGTTTHAGAIYNCRCYSESVLPTRDY